MAFTIVNISDDPISGLKRKVYVAGFLAFDEEAEQGEKMGRVFAKVIYFKNNNGVYGDLLGLVKGEERYAPYERNIEASNRRLVNPLNGLEVSFENNEYRDPLNNLVANPVEQLDFFINMLQNNNVNVVEILTNIVQTEDQYFQSFNI